MKNVFMFPGQGSQHQGMGELLFDQFKELVDSADTILGYSLRDLCLGKTEMDLNQTQFTQPALYCVNALEEQLLHDQGIQADLAMGHSLGEYNALLTAEVFDFETGLRLVQKRGELMAQACSGGMIAIIGLTVDEVRNVLRDNHLLGVDIANHNSKQQVVVSAPQSDLPVVMSVFKEKKAKKVVQLNVSGAFHSRYMEDVQDDFKEFLTGFSFQDPKIPVIANCTAKPYLKGSVVENLSKQLTHSVFWYDSLLNINRNDAKFFEVGPGRVLRGLLKRMG